MMDLMYRLRLEHRSDQMNQYVGHHLRRSSEDASSRKWTAFNKLAQVKELSPVSSVHIIFCEYFYCAAGTVLEFLVFHLHQLLLLHQCGNVFAIFHRPAQRNNKED